MLTSFIEKPEPYGYDKDVQLVLVSKVSPLEVHPHMTMQLCCLMTITKLEGVYLDDMPGQYRF